MTERSFLVIASSGLDDIPIRLFGTQHEAVAYAKKCVKVWPLGPIRVMGRGDIGDEHPSYISVMTFVDGVPRKYEVIHDWT